MTVENDVINTTIDRSRHTVLVVEDDPALRYATARLLRAAGFQTLEVGTGGSALAAVRDQAVSAVVLDVHLPDLNGFEVCRAIRADDRSSLLPIIHLSAAYIQNEDKVTGLNAGADAYLVHPVEPAVLVATLQALIRARLAEDNLRRSDTRFRAIYSQALSGIALVQANGRFADVNPSMAKMLGRNAEDLVDQAISDFAPPDWEAFVRERTISALEEGRPWQGEFPLVKADGSLVHLEWSISSHVEPGLRIAIAVDISERMELDRRRQEVLEREQAARAVAERHSRTKDDFVAVLSHELRTPLNAIAGWVHILSRQGDSPAMAKGLAAIDRNVKAQARIISDILDVSRINSGKLRLDREICDPADVVQGSLEALGASVEARRLQVRMDISPAAHGPAYLDPTRFQQIFWNLMTNAIKFSSEGGAIEVRLTRSGDRLELEVQDFGRGVKAEFLPHLFERFSQSDSPDNRFHGGLGLGLSIVRHLAELHGGEVHAESAGEGQGTTLRVSLDVHASAELADGPASEHPDHAPADLESAAQDRPLENLDVLIVEDNVDASEMLTVVLSDGGARVRLAGDYDTALLALSGCWPAVIVSDIGLPGRDGYELIRRIREMEQNHPGSGRRLVAVAFTAFSRPEDKTRALEAGFDVHLAKPLQPHVLMQAVARLVAET